MQLQALALLLTALAVTAHPGEDYRVEAYERAQALSIVGKRSLSHCAEKLAARGVHAANEKRRRALQADLVKHAQRRRDYATVLATDHKSNLTGVTAATSASDLFTGTNQCILAPETTEGPYYVTGEYFRQNVTESQQGVPLYVDIQVIDTNTCEPLPNVAFDFWHCNATGVYSGVVARSNGNQADASNLNATFLRGIQSTDSSGVVQFHSIVPGHYSGRTNHVHILAHTEGNWELLANNTISGGTTSAHVGQLFFDQSLLTEVEATAPYSTNTQSQTQNSEDNIMSGEAADVDPVLEYVLLGDTVSDGIFSWISVGINSTLIKTVSSAATYGADGGVANANSMGGGGGGGSGGPGGNGTMPSGGMGGGMNGTTGGGAAPGSASASAASTAEDATVSAGTSGALPLLAYGSLAAIVPVLMLSLSAIAI